MPGVPDATWRQGLRRRKAIMPVVGSTFFFVLGGCSVDAPPRPGVEGESEPTGATSATDSQPALTVDTAEETASESAVLPPEGPGSLLPVEVEELVTLPPVDVGDVVSITRDLTVDVHLAPTTAEAGRPGEIGGDAVAVTVDITSTEQEPRNASVFQVTLEDAEGTPLTPVHSDPFSPLDGQLAPGSSDEGTYVFTLDDFIVQPLTVYVMSAADEPVAVFVGSLQ